MGILLYIDPGTGSMLFTILIGLVSAGIYSLRMLLLKLKFIVSGGKAVDTKDVIPYVIFSDNKRYWTNFEGICREFDRRGIDISYMTASPDDPALSCGLPHVKAEFIGEGNKAFAKLNLLKADILLSTTPGLEVYQWKRSRDVKYYVHILHAANEVTTYRMFGIDYYDALLLSGPHHIADVRALEKLRHLPEKELLLAGIPYMDAMLKRLRDAAPLSHEGITVLLAPTWGPAGILAKYGERIIDALIETGYHLIIRPHPQSFQSEGSLIEKLMQRYPESEHLEWNRDTDNFEVLRRSDIMISDFSGVIFDFALIFDKPIVYTSSDIDTSVYDAWWLKAPLWTEEILPKLGKELTDSNFTDVKIIIDECLTKEEYASGREEARKAVWAYPGESSVRIVKYLINKREECHGLDRDRG